MRHFGFRKRSRRKLGNSVIHVPSTMGGTMNSLTATLLVIESPSIFAGGSASSNIEAQDKDRTANVGHHLGTLNLDVTIRNQTVIGVIEFCVMKVERHDTTPAIGTHPVPSQTDINNQGMQQACRLSNPGKVFHYSKRAYAPEVAVVHKIKVSPAKFRLSKVKAGDHWILIMFNRNTSGQITYDFEARYKEYE